MFRLLLTRFGKIREYKSVCGFIFTSFNTQVSSPTTGNKTTRAKNYWTSNVKKVSASYSNMTTLEKLNFDNLALRVLPIDPDNNNYVRQVSGACFSRVKACPVINPKTVAYSVPAMELLDLPESELNRFEFPDFATGNELLPGSEPAAHCYCGHQFGYFSGQLGDGAAMYLGEVINKKGERWEIQTKGSGKTPYSRSADGRKVLRSSVREFLCSEAMHHLGVPTTRCGSCVTSDTKVIRDIFYNGNAIKERCTVILRIAPSFIRFGSFEIFKDTDPETGRKGPSVGRTDILIKMIDYVIKTFYTEIWEAHKEDKKTAYIEFYKEIVKKTAHLVCEWHRVGWCHGVLNTDNMSIVGVTIDYGPFGFMDHYDPDFICNGSDDGGRYSFMKQAEICKWNCMKLAQALEPVIDKDCMREILKSYDGMYENMYSEMMHKKLGLIKKNLPKDVDLIQDFHDTMEKTGADFTNSFRCLSKIPLPGSEDFKSKLAEVECFLVTQCATLEEYKKLMSPKMDPRQLQMMMVLMESNPEIVSKLGTNQKMLTDELARSEKFKEVKEMTQAKKTEADKCLWHAWLKKYTERLEQEETSCRHLKKDNTERTCVMNATNPRVVLRNYIAQTAITAAEEGDYSEVRRVLEALEDPYSDCNDLAIGMTGGSTAAESTAKDSKGACSSGAVSTAQKCYASLPYDSKPPEWASDLRVT